MPDAAMKQAIREAYAAAPASEVILHTIEIRHPDFTTPIRVVRDHQHHDCKLEASAPEDPGATVTFTAFAFDFSLPDQSDRPSPEIVITLDNVSREIMGYLDAAAQGTAPIEVTYRPFLASDKLAGPQIDPPVTLIIREIQADVFRVTARAGFGDVANRAFPADLYDAERFPGLIAL